MCVVLLETEALAAHLLCPDTSVGGLQELLACRSAKVLVAGCNVHDTFLAACTDENVENLVAVDISIPVPDLTAPGHPSRVLVCVERRVGPWSGVPDFVVSTVRWFRLQALSRWLVSRSASPDATCLDTVLDRVLGETCCDSMIRAGLLLMTAAFRLLESTPALRAFGAIVPPVLESWSAVLSLFPNNEEVSASTGEVFWCRTTSMNSWWDKFRAEQTSRVEYVDMTAASPRLFTPSSREAACHCVHTWISVSPRPDTLATFMAKVGLVAVCLRAVTKSFATPGGLMKVVADLQREHRLSRNLLALLTVASRVVKEACLFLCSLTPEEARQAATWEELAECMRQCGALAVVLVHHEELMTSVGEDCRSGTFECSVGNWVQVCLAEVLLARDLWLTCVEDSGHALRTSVRYIDAAFVHVSCVLLPLPPLPSAETGKALLYQSVCMGMASSVKSLWATSADSAGLAASVSVALPQWSGCLVVEVVCASLDALGMALPPGSSGGLELECVCSAALATLMNLGKALLEEFFTKKAKLPASEWTLVLRACQVRARPPS